MWQIHWGRARMSAGAGITATVALLTLAHETSVRAEFFNVKPGGWEMTVTTIASGMKLAPEMAAKLTPQQRAQMEQMMKAREGKPHTTTMQSCLTKEDISQDRIIKEMEDEDDDSAVHCKVNVISKSSSKLVIDTKCPGPSPSTTHFTIEAKAPDSIEATGEREQQGSGKSRMTIKGRWVGAGCLEVNE